MSDATLTLNGNTYSLRFVEEALTEYNRTRRALDAAPPAALIEQMAEALVKHMEMDCTLHDDGSAERALAAYRAWKNSHGT